MYLYLYHNGELNIKQQSKKEMKSASEFSEQMVRRALSGFSERMQLGFTEEEIAKIEISRARNGKPYFGTIRDSDDKNFSGNQAALKSQTETKNQAETKNSVHFSISHSGEWWGCLMALEPVGFDLEVSRENVKFEKIALRFFTEQEYESVLAGGQDAFLRIWVRKEAYIKYLGTGLGEGLRSFSVIGDSGFYNVYGSSFQRINDSGFPCMNDAGSSTQIVKITENQREPMPCFVRECQINSGVKAAYCSNSGDPIKEMIPL